MRNLLVIGILSCLTSSPVLAQIIPDSTLGIENSIVRQNDKINTISGGATRGTNLFHSFQDFSVENTDTVIFKNNLNIENIITRVTGGKVSNINGLITANGTANLILINTNGIILGQNARLNIGGSFLATTANGLKFIDGTFFTTTALQNPPLLTISAPIGLNFENNSGAIRVQGNGHTLINPIFTPILGLNNSLGLQVQPGKTLGIVGSKVVLDGGILKAGRVEIGSVGSGLVTLASDWDLNYQGIQDFQDIELSRQALVDASGIPGGSIQVQGKTIDISDGSAIFIQNQGGQSSGGINVNASDLLKVSGTAPNGRIASTLLTETLTNGSGGDITISAKRIIVQDGGQLLPRTFGKGRGGNSTVNAFDSVQVIGFSLLYPNLFSNISAATFGAGDAGNLRVTTNQLVGINGIQIGSATFGGGSGGNVSVNAADVTLTGVVPGLLTPSTINAATFSTGNAGQVVVNSSRLRLENGGAVASSTTASGNAGSVTINASDFVVIDGVGLGSITPSLVDSSAIVLAQPLQQQLRVPSIPTGNSGDITINTPNLNISNGGLINVQNDGSGNAGNINITANKIAISNGGGITATTAIAEGGNIGIESKLVQLNNGNISATAGQQGTNGNGGNIRINADVIAGFNNSRITADAFQGRGGNIRINTQGLFLSPNSLVTASSQQGIDGNVETNVSRTQSELVNAQLELPKSTPEIASVCPGKAGAENRFVITGKGGLPSSPLESAYINPTWQPRVSNTASTINNFDEPKFSTTKIIPAQGWQFNNDGTVTLVAQANTTVNTAFSEPTCHTKISVTQ
ncbi:filamentous hemagglutinin N-terminal domain-containing protein [Nostoc sp. LEGE 06077]|uniref:two-partner secretion domain-containing protein n=1 Tax=Nostoc sp. LEGE 06077 TaxID=915325 RepID=UPI0018804B1B|nr:filamentous hemagglutinin N-terminal domain-containing protein [Nostoc sp. LEGE 06077]MBE9210872.1 filamentous hemagglutinin N-terminal domain-containing protein [Nostoc sp. LEGE 06077]